MSLLLLLSSLSAAQDLPAPDIPASAEAELPPELPPPIGARRRPVGPAPTGRVRVRGPAPAPLDDCRPALVASSAHTLSLWTHTGDLFGWRLPDKVPLAPWILDLPCYDLALRDDVALCATGQPALSAWRDTALTEVSATPDGAALRAIEVTPQGEIFAATAGGQVYHLPAEAALSEDLTLDERVPNLGRNLRDLALDPTGGVAAQLHSHGRTWIGTWPDSPRWTWISLAGEQDEAEAESDDDGPIEARRLRFAGPDTLVATMADGTLRIFAVLSPRLPVPLPILDVPTGTPDVSLAWIEPAGPLVAVRGSDGPLLLVDGQGVLSLNPTGAPVIAAISANGGSAEIVRCDGSIDVQPLPHRAPLGLAEEVHKLLAEGEINGAADLLEARLREARPDADALIRATRTWMPLGAPANQDPLTPMTTHWLLTLTRGHFKAAREQGAWAYPLVRAGVYLEAAEELAPHDPEVIAARYEFESLRRERLIAWLRNAFLSGSVGLLIGLLVLRWQARRSATDRVVEANFNPFRLDSPHDPKRTPFAEHPLVDDILRGLGRNCVVIEAPPFSGKTALLRHLSWRLSQEGLEGQSLRVAWLALRGVPEDRFWTELGHALAAAAPDLPASADLLEDEHIGRFAVENLLDELWEWDEGVDLAARRVVLVLDDLDVLGGYAYENQRFRALVQVLPATRLTVLGAARSIRLGWDSGQLDSPWFNIFQVRELRPFRPEEVARYVAGRLSAPFRCHPDVPAQLYRASQGRPLFLWHLAYATVEEALLHRTTEIQPAMVVAAEDAIQHLINAEFATMLEQDRAYEVALRQIAELRRRREALLARAAGSMPWRGR